jgi:hypothetical protein
MGKHVVDQNHHETEDSRAKRYADIERESGEAPGRAAQALHRQEKSRDPDEKLKRFTEIERGKES